MIPESPKRKERRQRRLREVMESIPGEIAGCTGECFRSCGPVPMMPVEWEAIADHIDGEMPKKLQGDDGITCPFLSDEHRCTVYSVRPLLCRLWGVAEGLPCEFGCRPEYEVPRKTAWRMLEKIRRLMPGEVKRFEPGDNFAPATMRNEEREVGDGNDDGG